MACIVATVATVATATSCGLLQQDRSSIEFTVPPAAKTPGQDAEVRHEDGRLSARPLGALDKSGSHGLQELRLGSRRDILLYVPPGYRDGTPAPLALALHGAGGGAKRGLEPLFKLADDAGLILLSPSSQGRTWDVVLGGFGRDVGVIDRALKYVFERYAIDGQRLAVEGFSDGASYALSLAITNGDLFSHVLAFSPGFAAPGEPHGSPSIFVSHGVDDGVLPIGATSRRLVPQLQRAGYDVSYREFDGKHAAPPEIVRQAIAWFLGPRQ